MQITSFVAVLTLDVMRRERGAYDVLCCVKAKNAKVRPTACVAEWECTLTQRRACPLRRLRLRC